MLYKDLKFHDFHNGEQRDVYDGFIKLNIDENQYEYIEYDGLRNETLSYSENWKWLDTYLSKTHLEIRLDFNSYIGFIPYKIIELNERVLKIESIRQAYGPVDKIQLTFSKSEVHHSSERNYQKRVPQYPANVIGSWKLAEFKETTSDSTWTKFSNDTVLIQSYSMVGYKPIYYVKTYSKYYCRLTMDIMENGEFLAEKYVGEKWERIDATEWRIRNTGESNRLFEYKDYWNWVDHSNQHEIIHIINFFPSINFLIRDYSINFISANEFELTYELETLHQIVVYYRYVREE